MPNKVEDQRLNGQRNVNAAGIWNEGYLSYHRRSLGRMKTAYARGSKQVYREKSAEAIAVRTQACPGMKRYGRKSYDPVIPCKSRRSAKTTMGSILSFIEKMFFLKVNGYKTKVVYIKDIKFLVCSFYRYKGEGR
jgi:hypothetical protein